MSKASYQVIKHGSHVAVGESRPLADNFVPTGTPQPLQVSTTVEVKAPPLPSVSAASPLAKVPSKPTAQPRPVTPRVG